MPSLHRIRNRQVSGSSPLVGSRFYAGSKQIDLLELVFLSRILIPCFTDMPILWSGDLSNNASCSLEHLVSMSSLGESDFSQEVGQSIWIE